MPQPQRPDVARGRRRAALAGLVLASASAVTFIVGWEGNVNATYRDIVGVNTVCAGITDPDIAVPGKQYTELQCRELNTREIEHYAAQTMSCLTGRVSQGELDAYTSLAYNIGPAAFCASTAARMANEGNRLGACDQILRWNRAGGKVVRGLDNRRKAEHQVCLAAVKGATS